MNIILCELRHLKDLLSLSPLITINNILSGVLSKIAFYLTFYVAFLLHRIVLYSVCMYRIVAIQPFGCDTVIKFHFILFGIEHCNGRHGVENAGATDAKAKALLHQRHCPAT